MLVLTRRPNERVVIDCPPGYAGRIVLTFCTATEGRVKIGFDAASEVQIHREEVALRIDQAKADACTAAWIDHGGEA